MCLPDLAQELPPFSHKLPLRSNFCHIRRGRRIMGDQLDRCSANFPDLPALVFRRMMHGGSALFESQPDDDV
jgi:hypothetical protein